MAKNKKILEDHKKIGKKLVPPMMHSLPLQETDYINDLLPEIIWIGLIHESIGYRNGIDMVRSFVKSVYDSYESENYINFSIASNLNKLSAQEKEKCVQKLLKNEIFLEVSEILSPLVYFYSDSPFSFLNREVDLTKAEEVELLGRLKKCIANHFDRYGTPSAMAQLNVFYTRVLDGKIFFTRDMNIPDFNSLLDAPDSEEARMAAAFVRSEVKQEYMFGRYGYDNAWSKSFWNQSYFLGDCELGD